MCLNPKCDRIGLEHDRALSGAYAASETVYDHSALSPAEQSEASAYLIKWCAENGLDADRIHGNSFRVERDGGKVTAHYREFLKKSEGGVSYRYLDPNGDGYAKSDWQSVDVTSVPTPFGGAK